MAREAIFRVLAKGRNPVFTGNRVGAKLWQIHTEKYKGRAPERNEL